MNKMQRAEMKARKFLRENNFSIPFDIQKALKILNVKLMYDSKLKKLPAMTIINLKGQKLITVNSNYPEDQQRFSICHEISHIVLEHQGSFQFTTQITEKTLDEKCADACASELLIPRHKLPAIAYKNNFDIQKLKRIFKVSEGAMVVKMRIIKLPYKNSYYNNNKNF